MVKQIELGLSLLLLVAVHAVADDDQVDETCGQISPEIEQARKTLKQTGTDTD